MVSRRCLLVIVSAMALSAFSLLAPYAGAAPPAARAGKTPADSPRPPGLAAVAAGTPRNLDPLRELYDDLIATTAAEEGVDANLVRAIITVESGFDQYAVSRKGARGLMQLMPGTAARYAVRDPFDPEANLRGGIRYLRFLQGMFPGRLPWALAAYNAGENAVLRHNGIPPFPETREYVTRVLNHYTRRGAETPRPAPPIVREAGSSTALTPTLYRVVDADMSVTYTNVPPGQMR
jgi:soluble lytic murein transglycosylase-like protein